ncbi:hypothetical protein [Alcaligenes endophyticus]|uniref:Branched-chain amino acid transport n=1 Tax=Alcaligenes endophyticus TaxID=1929088 RepID=A0ABT8EK16_9BURK|nr:hypothetical protein [Alcaligenes endophyticus]MCX5591941.1 hypothetical protein [Alcaligenes endophyticus]MDN4121631.1 hypothetical protein [Alcaligenes endophyticus]
MQDITVLMIVIALAGLGTYLIRVLPMKWHERGQQQHSDKAHSTRLIPVLQAIGPAAIVALLCISLAGLLTPPSWLSDSLCVALGLLGVMVGHRLGGIAIGTLLGVLTYGLSLYVLL